MKVVILDDRRTYVRDAQIDEIGAIVVRGPNVFEGYLITSQNESLFVRDKDGDHWLDTGDLGRRDAEGYFWLTGRKKELIIRGGHNIDPASIEEPLQRHPAVLLAAAVGRPDAHAGELPVAYVELRSGMSANEDDLLHFLAQEISERAALPKSLRILDKMPLTAVGKIYKPALKKRETEATLSAALRDAGVPVERLELIETADRGSRLVLKLAGAAEEARAAEVLGRYAFPFVIET